jgi:hypothetical protein
MKKILIGMGIIVSGLALAFVFAAGVHPMSASADGENGGTISQTQTVVQVDSSGRALLRGTIDAVNGRTLTVKSWGGDWTLNVNASAEILPASVGQDLTQFKNGDFIGVQGIVSQTAVWTIDASVVRDRTLEQTMIQQRQENIQNEHDVKGAGPMNFQGTVSNLNGSSFMLTTQDGATFTVNIAAGAQIMNVTRLTLPLVSIANGNTVRVWGTNASGTITAQIVRDLSIGVIPASGR